MSLNGHTRLGLSWRAVFERVRRVNDTDDAPGSWVCAHLVRFPGLGAAYWFDNFQSQYVFAALAGVAIASVLGTKRSGPSPE